MDAGTAKKLIEKNLSYDEVKRLTVKLVQHASPQTPLLEAEPQVLALIKDVVRPELEASGLKPVIDRMGNLILHIKGRERTDRLMLVGYAMCAAPSTMQNPYSGAIVDGAPYKLDGECVWGRGACEQKGSLAAMMAAMKFIGAGKLALPTDLYFVVSTAGETGRHDSSGLRARSRRRRSRLVRHRWPAGDSIGQQGPGRCARYGQGQAGAQQPPLGGHRRHRRRDEGVGKTQTADAVSRGQISSGARQSKSYAQRDRKLSQGDAHDSKRVPHHVRPASVAGR